MGKIQVKKIVDPEVIERNNFFDKKFALENLIIKIKY